MTLLVLGGTGFVGGATVTEALRRGWSVTVFNRGLHGAVPGGVLRLRGGPLGSRRALGAGRRRVGPGDRHLGWGAGCRPERRTSAGRLDRALRLRVQQVGLPGAGGAGADERAPVVDAVSDALGGGYAELKVGGERAAREVFGERALIARAGLILGPGEDIGRLPWWLQRVARGGQVLAPGPPDLPLQYIDARDLVSWPLDLGRERVGGTSTWSVGPGTRPWGSCWRRAG